VHALLSLDPQNGSELELRERYDRRKLARYRRFDAGAYRINVIRDLHGRADLLIETIARIDEIYAIRAAGRHF
jgi:hypothetical protein